MIRISNAVGRKDMSFTLEKVVPWGRCYDEYSAMFSLSDADLNKRILGCGDGPAGFNAELTGKGGRIVSVDPIYKFSAEEIRQRIEATYDQVMAQTEENRDEFVWSHIKSVQELGRIRMKAMNRFLEDYPNGGDRYRSGELPVLPFDDSEFNLALCSHCLFLYSEQFTADFHIRSLKELCRVAGEVRVFPLLELGSKMSRHLDEVMEILIKNGYSCTIVKVPYEFQKNGDEMLIVKKKHSNSL